MPRARARESQKDGADKFAAAKRKVTRDPFLFVTVFSHVTAYRRSQIAGVCISTGFVAGGANAFERERGIFVPTSVPP